MSCSWMGMWIGEIYRNAIPALTPMADRISGGRARNPSDAGCGRHHTTDRKSAAERVTIGRRCPEEKMPRHVVELPYPLLATNTSAAKSFAAPFLRGETD